MAFLGNPTSKYAKTRHNVGWMIADHLFPAASWSAKFHAKVANHNGVHLLKPETYMNESGRSVRAAMDFYGLGAEELLVVHDDLELAFGEIVLQQGGGLGGHKGLRSIVQHLKDDQFLRLRFGIGRPPFGSVSSWVLQRFDAVEQAQIPDLLRLAEDLVSMRNDTLPIKRTLAFSR